MENNLVVNAVDIEKQFSNGDITVNVLKGVSLSVADGEFVAIVGESGSGKSTLLYCLAGIDKPTNGTVQLVGRDLSSISDKELAEMRRREVSFVYQYDNLVENLSAYENITLPLVLDKKKESEYQEKVKEICDFLGISERLKNRPKELSGGEQQRVALARALVTSPKVIFLDEPTGSLDKERGEQVMQLLEKINKERGVALVMVTHSSAHSQYASRIVEIEDGIIK